jgi:hypothetical protein
MTNVQAISRDGDGCRMAVPAEYAAHRARSTRPPKPAASALDAARSASLERTTALPHGTSAGRRPGRDTRDVGIDCARHRCIGDIGACSVGAKPLTALL